MFDRFTDRARKMMGLARQESQRFNHDYIGTEHMLLGLARMTHCVATDIFKNLDVQPGRIVAAVEKRVEPGMTMVTVGQRPFTPRAKKVLELSVDEARTLGHNYVGTAHLLLGLIREEEGIAKAALVELNVHLDDVREATLKLSAPSRRT